ncbi:MAG: hypothetical protein EBR67_03675 [Proteobacteria bacterium]|nr:hypothetical protein [Pseudomonadota bacterium]
MTYFNPFAFLFTNSGSSTTNTTASTNTSGAINNGQVSNLPENEKELLLKLMHAEAGGEGVLGMALVAKSVLNRQDLIKSGKIKAGEFNAKGSSLTEIISAKNQYQPYAQGKLNAEISAANKEKALRALNLALNPDQLKSELKKAGKTDDQINKLMAATGFRAGYAFNDSSQNVNNVVVGNHTFNTAGNKELASFA